MSARRLRRAASPSFAIVFLFGAVAFGQSEPEGLFSAATRDLQEGRPDEAIARLETMADRGMSDAAASFNRGLAYANRASSTSSKPGDLGQAACAFAEARSLNTNAAFGKRIASAEAATQRELGRRLAARGGGGGLMEPPAPLFHQLLALLPAPAWAGVGAFGSVLCILAFVLYLKRRGGSAVHGLGLAGLLLFGVGTFAENRTRAAKAAEESACIVVENATLLREPSLASRGEPLREGAHIFVQKGASDESFALVRWGSLVGYVTPRSLRRLAHP